MWSTSVDGESWSPANIIRSGDAGHKVSVWFDGTYLHYVYMPLAEASPIYYRRGVPNTDGSITWSVDEQVVKSGEAGVMFVAVHIAVDSYGYPWITYLSINDVRRPFVTKSSTNDGTWVTQDGFPYQVFPTTRDCDLNVVPLTAGKVYVIVAYTNGIIRGKLWTGSWGPEESATVSRIPHGTAFSTTAINDDVHVVFLTTANDIIHVERTYGVGWSSEVVVQPSVSGGSYPIISHDISELYCFWAHSPVTDHVYYKKCVEGVWDATPTDWIDDTVEGRANSST
ncbi:unnamed protein product, partial [marine sediment metagenome]